MKREAPENNGIDSSPTAPDEVAAAPASSRSFSAGQIIFECKPFVAVLDRKWKFSVSQSERASSSCPSASLAHSISFSWAI